jgi:hypothetical protein
VGQYRFADAQAIKHVECIWPKLDAVTDNAEFGRLLNQANAKSLTGQCKRYCRTAQTTPDDQD